MSINPISDGLRRALRSAEASRYRIARETGISEGQLSGFLSGSRGLSLPTLDTLARYLRLELRQRTGKE